MSTIRPFKITAAIALAIAIGLWPSHSFGQANSQKERQCLFASGLSERQGVFITQWMWGNALEAAVLGGQRSTVAALLVCGEDKLSLKFLNYVHDLAQNVGEKKIAKMIEIAIDNFEE